MTKATLDFGPRASPRSPLGNSRLRAMTNIERQEMAERIAYQVVISSLAHKEYLRSGDRAQLGELQQAVTTMLQQQGVPKLYHYY